MSESGSARLVRAVLGSLVLSRVDVRAAVELPLRLDRVPHGEFLALTQAHRVGAMVMDSPLFAEMPEPLQARLEQRRSRAAFRCMRQMSEQADWLGRFDQWGIRCLAMKGSTFSTIAYGDWLARGVSADLDFVIAPDDLSAAHLRLLGRGYSCVSDRDRQAPLTGWRGRYNTFLHYERTYVRPGRSPIDLHWRLLPGGAKWNQFEALWQSRRCLTTPAGQADTLGSAHATIVAADQAVTDGWPDLRACADVVAMSRAADPDQFLQAARAYGPLEGAVREASSRLWRFAQGEDLRPSRAGWSANARQWRARRASGTWAGASGRAVLGRFLPARSLSPVQAPPE